MIDSMQGLARTHMAGQINREHIGQTVVLMGWVQRRRDHGGLVFIDLRDRTGLVQAVFNPEEDPQTHERSHAVRAEYVLAVTGEVRPRPADMVNPKLATGEIEVFIKSLRVLNTAETPPIHIEDDIEASESVRLKYRYLDLRRPAIMEKMIMRHKAAQVVRSFFTEEGFIEVETPVLTKSTPEGARDYLVPSRVSQGLFFALPQSPQLFKQLLMVAGFDRYFQVVKCFRDEDLRADRQPEFTQIDLEMSFVNEEDIQAAMERLMVKLFKKIKGLDLVTPFRRITYDEAMARFGVDRPDLRFGLELVELTDLVAKTGFKLFAQTAATGGVVKAINARGQAELSRKNLDDLTEFVKIYGAKGLAWVKIKQDGWQSPIAKFFSDEEKKAIEERMEAAPGDLLLFSADSFKVVSEVLGQLRVKLAQDQGLLDKNEYSFVWVTHFPMFEYSATEKRYEATHHPFTSPLEEDLDRLETAPEQIRTRAYDLVLNGSEIGGGSIRIHRPDVQERVFGLLGLSAEDIERKFGFLVEALRFGAPPHGGLAFGFDRLAMIMAGADSIRDVIAFPKTQKATCLMTGAPSRVDVRQLLELGVRVEKTAKKE